MKSRLPKGDTQEIRQETRLTRPPRMEGRVKEAMMQPKRKPKAARKTAGIAKKAQGYSERQRKDYQLKSKRR